MTLAIAQKKAVEEVIPHYDSTTYVYPRSLQEAFGHYARAKVEDFQEDAGAVDFLHFFMQLLGISTNKN